MQRSHFALTHAIKDHLYVPIANEKPSASSSTMRVLAQIPSYHAEQTAVPFSNGLMQPTVCCNAEAKAECSWTSPVLAKMSTPLDSGNTSTFDCATVRILTEDSAECETCKTSDIL